MEAEIERNAARHDDDIVIQKLNNIETVVQKQAVERKGSGRALIAVVIAGAIYVGSGYWFSEAGKQQRPIAVEFTAMAINQSVLQQTYSGNLNRMLAELPDARAPEQNFTANSVDLANKIIQLNANVINSAKLSLSAASFLPIVRDNLQAQFSSRALSSDQLDRLKKTIDELSSASSHLTTCRENLEKEAQAYLSGMSQGAASDAHAQALVQQMKTITSLVRHDSQAMKCMQTVDKVTTLFPQLAQIHDDGVLEYNKRGQDDARYLGFARAIAGLVIFFISNSARAYIQGFFSERFKKSAAGEAATTISLQETPPRQPHQ